MPGLTIIVGLALIMSAIKRAQLYLILKLEQKPIHVLVYHLQEYELFVRLAPQVRFVEFIA